MDYVDTRPSALQDTESDPFDRFRCNDRHEVGKLMRELRDGGVCVTLSAPAGVALAASVGSVDVDRQRIALDVESGDPALQTLVDGNEATAVAFLASIKLQFDLQDLVLVRGGRAIALQSRLPSHVYRFQRRGAYRVPTPDRKAPTAALRHPSMPDMVLRLRLLDVSIGGCALLLPPDTPPLPMDMALHGVTIELDTATRLVASLWLQHVSSLQSPVGAHRLGCALQVVDPSSARKLQVYIDQTQKRRRLLSRD